MGGLSGGCDVWEIQCSGFTKNWLVTLQKIEFSRVYKPWTVTAGKSLKVQHLNKTVNTQVPVPVSTLLLPSVEEPPNW